MLGPVFADATLFCTEVATMDAANQLAFDFEDRSERDREESGEFDMAVSSEPLGDVVAGRVRRVLNLPAELEISGGWTASREVEYVLTQMIGELPRFQIFELV